MYINCYNINKYIVLALCTFSLWCSVLIRNSHILDITLDTYLDTAMSYITRGYVAFTTHHVFFLIDLIVQSF